MKLEGPYTHTSQQFRIQTRKINDSLCDVLYGLQIMKFTTRTMCFESPLLVQAVDSPDALMCSVCSSARTAEELQHLYYRDSGKSFRTDSRTLCQLSSYGLWRFENLHHYLDTWSSEEKKTV